MWKVALWVNRGNRSNLEMYCASRRTFSVDHKPTYYGYMDLMRVKSNGSICRQIRVLDRINREFHGGSTWFPDPRVGNKAGR